jgi:hypothetical protein
MTTAEGGSRDRVAVDSPDDDVMVLDEVAATPELPIWEPTGEPSVDLALELLDALDPDDVHGHAEVYDRIHGRLRQTLTEADARTS